jgi:hypothetical protein
MHLLVQRPAAHKPAAQASEYHLHEPVLKLNLKCAIFIFSQLHTALARPAPSFYKYGGAKCIQATRVTQLSCPPHFTGLCARLPLWWASDLQSGPVVLVAVGGNSQGRLQATL